MEVFFGSFDERIESIIIIFCFSKRVINITKYALTREKELNIQKKKIL